MAAGNQSNDVVLLFDYYNREGELLHGSFKAAGYDYPVVVIQEDGFLPDGLIGVYSYYLGDYSKNTDDGLRCPGKPRYFNKIDIPDYWEISADSKSGKVMDKSHIRAKIYYTEPREKRLVKAVDWLDESGTVRYTELYNKYGVNFARTIYNKKGEKVQKTYFSVEGKEIITENFVTGSIILDYNNQTYVFKNKTEFVRNLIKELGYDKRRIFFNSLSTPFFVSESLTSEEKKDVLFWQEPTYDSIPGNMQIILRGNASRASKVMVQKRSSYDKLISYGANKDMVNSRGYVYPYIRDNRMKKEILICTNSDRVEKLKEIVEALPNMHVHVAAITEMSSKLMAFSSYENVSLYPNVKPKVVDELFEKCDYYFDVNHENEILNALERAYLNNMLIVGFNGILHKADYIAENHRFNVNECADMCEFIKLLADDEMMLDLELRTQREFAMDESNDKFSL